MTQSYRTFKMVASCEWMHWGIAIYFNAFFVLRGGYMMDFLTIKEVTEKWNVTPRRIQKMCAEGRIPGAKKFGRDWAIPADTEKPIDARVKTGQYRNWRKN